MFIAPYGYLPSPWPSPKGRGNKYLPTCAVAVTPFQNRCDLGSLLPLFAIDKGRRVGDEGDQAITTEAIDKLQSADSNRGGRVD